ncbi:acetate--CoA ligase family protein [Conexibacter sp. CPCC 206217]|uniref:acetate--CoA ligase family protein n=1 Tax=Conexibacter sp. CPCC 206217 TaxID=3064574 RepID=UPI002718F3BC|nr:acetate--CoA ligase family protein [Conexibacter sp. CPCC 206217]MDO8208876.1 acetate--CoA ligase family protein [Conexibacter sp. CPCC 206217]
MTSLHDQALDAGAAAALIRPRSVAIVGISGAAAGTFRPGGRAVFDHLRRFGYDGRLYPVNPRYDQIDGVQAFPALAELPEAPDCAVVAVPAAAVPQTIRDCGEAGVRNVLLLSSGFGELGPEGAALDAELRAAMAASGVRVLGPNTTGIANVADGCYLTMTSVLAAGGLLRSGPIALLLQSGALGSCVIDRARSAGVGAGCVVSLGNQVDLDAADFLAHFATDERIEAISLYAEGVPDGPRYRRAVEQVLDTGKRLFVLLGGASELGERAATSHTGRIAGRAALERALLRETGATLVDDPDDLWRTPTLHARHPARFATPTMGVGIFTISGGLAVLAADQLGHRDGFDLPEPSEATRQALTPWLPGYVGARNPLDLGPGTMPDGFQPALAAFAADAALDAVAVVLPVVATAWQPAVVDGVLAVAETLDKPLLVCWYAGDSAAASVERLRGAGVVVVESPRELASVLDSVHGPAEAEPDAERAPEPASEATMSDWEVLSAIAHAGGEVAPMRLARTRAEVVEAAAELGFPVVVKALVPGVAHKSEHGLVAVAIADAAALEQRLDGLAAAAASAGAPDVAYLVQAMAGSGVEVVLSVRRDAALGTFVGVGLGGILIELLHDVRYAPHPLPDGAFERLLEELAGSALLRGYRGRPGADRAWIERTLDALVEAAEQLGAAELEVNPAIVGPHGGVIVDALAVGRAA